MLVVTFTTNAGYKMQCTHRVKQPQKSTNQNLYDKPAKKRERLQLHVFLAHSSYTKGEELHDWLIAAKSIRIQNL